MLVGIAKVKEYDLLMYQTNIFGVYFVLCITFNWTNKMDKTIK
jgi:hypothetical protein